MANPTVVTTATLTFGSDTYQLKSIPGNQPKTCEAVDVTVLSDAKKHKAPGAVVSNDEISAVIAGDVLPAINSKAALTLNIGSSTVNVGNAVVKSVTPDNVEASGTAREAKATVVFQATGEADET